MLNIASLMWMEIVTFAVAAAIYMTFYTPIPSHLKERSERKGKPDSEKVDEFANTSLKHVGCSVACESRHRPQSLNVLSSQALLRMYMTVTMQTLMELSLGFHLSTQRLIIKGFGVFMTADSAEETSVRQEAKKPNKNARQRRHGTDNEASPKKKGRNNTGQPHLLRVNCLIRWIAYTSRHWTQSSTWRETRAVVLIASVRRHLHLLVAEVAGLYSVTSLSRRLLVAVQTCSTISSVVMISMFANDAPEGEGCDIQTDALTKAGDEPVPGKSSSFMRTYVFAAVFLSGALLNCRAFFRIPVV